MGWVDKKDEKIAAQVVKGIDKANKKLEKQNAKIQQRIEKAKSKGDIDKVNQWKEQNDTNTEAIGINNRTKEHLACMGKRSSEIHIGN